MVLSASLMLALARGAHAQTLETKLIKGDKTVRLVAYPAECRDDYWECVVADVGCPAPGEFTASIGLSSKEAGVWLTGGSGVRGPRPRADRAPGDEA